MDAGYAIEGDHKMRREFKWTAHQLDKLHKVQEILDELNRYKPLTLRQVYYQLVGKGYIENKVSQYGMLSNLLKWARIDGHIAWEDIEDRVRSFYNLSGQLDKKSFVDSQLWRFLLGYRRNLMQSQDKYIEVWIEKDALSSIFTRVCSPYRIPVVVCRGFSSVSFLHEFKQRLDYRASGISSLMLYFGDFDPSGIEMLESMQITLETELGASDIEFKRVALQMEDIEKYHLPHNPSALKHTDSRAKKHLRKYGSLAVELDALRPDDLERKIRLAIEDEIDIDKYHEEFETEEYERNKIAELKDDAEGFILDKLAEED